MADLFKNIISSFGMTDWIIIGIICLLVLLLFVKNGKPNIQKLTAIKSLDQLGKSQHSLLLG